MKVDKDQLAREINILKKRPEEAHNLKPTPAQFSRSTYSSLIGQNILIKKPQMYQGIHIVHD